MNEHRKKVEKNNIKDIAEFLNDINKGQLTYQDNVDTTQKNDSARFSLNKNYSKLTETESTTGGKGIKNVEQISQARKMNMDKIKSILENK